MTTRRLWPAALVFGVAAAAVGVARSVGPTDSLSSRHVGAAEYKVILPSQPGGVADRGLTALDATTNLPDGTIVEVGSFNADVEGRHRTTVRDRRVKISLANNLCHDTEVGLVGTAWRVTVTLLPEYHDFPSGPFELSPVPPVRQPPHVRDVLGSRLELLQGEQVRKANGMRYLETSRTYELPSETCTSQVIYTGLAGEFQQIPVGKKVPIDAGPFPRRPFQSCPNVLDALPIEAGDWGDAERVSRSFDVALQTDDDETLGRLADDSVKSFRRGWHPTGSPDPQAESQVPSSLSIPKLIRGCGAFVALRTRGVALRATPPSPTMMRGDVRDGVVSAPKSTTYLLTLRSRGWRVWGSIAG